MKLNSRPLLLTALALSLLSFNCAKEKEENPEYVKTIKEWKQKREESLKKPMGWLNLAGLYWLKEGENSFGSAKDNDLVFPDKAAPNMGTLTLKDSIVTFKAANGVKILVNGKEQSEAALHNDLEEDTGFLTYGDLKWNIIKRGERYGVRLRDLNSPNVKNFAGIESFPVKESWKIKARFVPYNPPKVLSIPTVIGTVEEDTARGYLSFMLDGKEYKLDPTGGADGLFIVFADQTSGKETYGAGRFLYTDGPDSTGYVTLDFNKAYNPPCAFSRYATCPMPPEQNRLHVRIEAGELTYKGEH